MKSLSKILNQLSRLDSKPLVIQKNVLLDVSNSLRDIVENKSYTIEERKLANKAHSEIQLSILTIIKMIKQNESAYNKQILISSIELN